jgi:hypothetical protein
MYVHSQILTMEVKEAKTRHELQRPASVRDEEPECSHTRYTRVVDT